MPRTPARIDSIGVARRLQALVAIGHSQSSLAARLGILPSHLGALIRQRNPHVNRKTFFAVRGLFTSLWSRPLTGPIADRARRTARENGWVGPLAWDDIDDPAERPNLTGRGGIVATAGPFLDEIAIENAIRGRGARLRRAERHVAVARLHADHWSDNGIARLLHVDARTILRDRQELDLEAFDFTDIRQDTA